jgi:cytochrome c553
MLRVGGKPDVESLALYFASQTPVKRGGAAVGDPAAGEPLSAMCGGCHGVRGVSSDAATPSLAGQDAQYLIAAIKAYGKTRRHETMESQVAKLSERDVRNIAAFYAAQAPHAAEKGHTLVQELADKCNRCHREGTDNPSMAVPRIQGQDKDYLVMALRAYRDDRRESSVMHRMSLPFSDAVIESLAALYASQPPP